MSWSLSTTPSIICEDSVASSGYGSSCNTVSLDDLNSKDEALPSYVQASFLSDDEATIAFNPSFCIRSKPILARNHSRPVQKRKLYSSSDSDTPRTAPADQQLKDDDDLPQQCRSPTCLKGRPLLTTIQSYHKSNVASRGTCMEAFISPPPSRLCATFPLSLFRHCEHCATSNRLNLGFQSFNVEKKSISLGGIVSALNCEKLPWRESSRLSLGSRLPVSTSSLDLKRRKLSDLEKPPLISKQLPEALLYASPQQVKCVSTKRISCLPHIGVHTVMELMQMTPSLQICFVDCRFPYEYEAGHIRGAVNLYTVDMVHDLLCVKKLSGGAGSSVDVGEVVFIFYCEYSSNRGPKLAEYLRSWDRSENVCVYPHLHFPHTYVLEGGYRAMYSHCQDQWLRDPSTPVSQWFCPTFAYTTMYDKSKVELRAFYSRIVKASEAKLLGVKTRRWR